MIGFNCNGKKNRYPFYLFLFIMKLDFILSLRKIPISEILTTLLLNLIFSARTSPLSRATGDGFTYLISIMFRDHEMLVALKNFKISSSVTNLCFTCSYELIRVCQRRLKVLQSCVFKWYLYSIKWTINQWRLNPFTTQKSNLLENDTIIWSI